MFELVVFAGVNKSFDNVWSVVSKDCNSIEFLIVSMGPDPPPHFQKSTVLSCLPSVRRSSKPTPNLKIDHVTAGAQHPKILLNRNSNFSMSSAFYPSLGVNEGVVKVFFSIKDGEKRRVDSENFFLNHTVISANHYVTIHSFAHHRRSSRQD